MLSKLFLGLIAAKATLASPITGPLIDSTPDTVAEAQELAKFLHDIQRQKIFLSETEWKDLLTQNGILHSPPEIDYDFLNFTVDVEVNVDMHVNAGMEKRQECDDITIHRVTKTEHFLDWDKQMSNVACAHQSPIDIMVMDGNSVANSITVSGKLEPAAIFGWATVAFGIDWSRTWTSSSSNTNKATVVPGNCGAMVLNPMTTRRYGLVSKGCLDHEKPQGTFMLDDRLSANFNGIHWVEGAISDCQKKASRPPISRCEGAGDLI